MMCNIKSAAEKRPGWKDTTERLAGWQKGGCETRAADKKRGWLGGDGGCVQAPSVKRANRSTLQARGTYSSVHVLQEVLYPGLGAAEDTYQ